MLSHDEVWTAIDALADKNGLSPSGLARRSGLDPTTFNKSKRFAPDGRPRWPSTESISKILKATETSISELFGVERSGGPGAPDLAIPLLGHAHAGFEPHADTATGPSTLPLPARIISFPDRRHEPLYALSVVGDSMQPLYRDGDILFISTNAVTRPGDRVVVKLRNSDVMVKLLKDDSGDQLSFHAVNPDHPDVSFSTENVEWMAKIVYATQ
ncbi:helix-turn-helix transcriptional regulator [Acuticoccus sp. M5D2P5]|uniref:helix-turn-helix transcriptional regulator n=1 Tax=Acuticoccus kalidii TaxID=2910977 RepID=UPI001F40D3C0|nr:helix-turn-helix transcriptional regulator [Acuticoccus kalidii]MCF3933652.1 helix-turn-helix transcriptional regulator [Acuticoccus kalidii]